MEPTGDQAIVEEGNYNLIAETGNNKFEITHLVLKASNGSKRVWKLTEMSQTDVAFKIEKFA